jgi:Putative prokaryotic signal transducing protein
MAEQEELVTIRRFRETFEAELAKGRLDSAGIPSFLVGENTALLYGTGLGGLQLQVSPQDEADALTILNDPGGEDVAGEGSQKKTGEGMN